MLMKALIINEKQFCQHLMRRVRMCCKKYGNRGGQFLCAGCFLNAGFQWH